MEHVSVWAEDVIIPTYEAGEPDKNPMFLEKRVYQGSSGKVYPYPTIESISKTKTDKSYKAVFLENDFIKIMVLPELGGRIQRAYDKTNGYDFVYHNNVIKPALVGLLGPWISGGIEFNWPQHHRPTTFMPLNYTIRKNNDGSQSLIVNDIDEMYGTKALTMFTLHPGKAYIEIEGQLYNGTSLPQTFLWWANPAVEANEYTQSIFPPDVHSVYDHGKRDVSRFPIATGEYYKFDYSEGIDISRYKNIPVPTSFMAEKSNYDFIGGYDNSKRAGILHVADHHISPGKKQWTWGNGQFGKVWDRNLTENDGPYVELMTGMYTDNQPDFTWLKPFEEKTFKQYFMPYKAVGEVKNATIDAAVNIVVKANDIYVCAYATSIYKDTEITIYEKNREILKEIVELSPNSVYEKSIPATIENRFDVVVQIKHKDKILVEYQEVDQGIPEIAEPAKAAKEPEEIFTNEELYLTGQHIEQYRHATYLPDAYYLEGLKRDTYDIRINDAYGLLLLRRGCFAESEGYFKKAKKRLMNMNPNPYNSEVLYHLGLSLFYQEKDNEAFDEFYKATWTSEQQEQGFYYLALIESKRKEWESAYMLIEKSLVKNSHNIKARGLKGIILRKLGKCEEARLILKENLELDPFDYLSHAETTFLNNDKNSDEIKYMMENSYEFYLQVARNYIAAGCYEEALYILESSHSDRPMIHYYKGYCYEKLDDDKANGEYNIAENSDPAYTFPNKLEDICVLESAINHNPEGAKANYYLGNLYYDKLQFEKAIMYWEKSYMNDYRYPTVIRNLGLAYCNKRKDVDKAITMFEEAFKLDKNDARVFMELDQIRKKHGVSLEERLASFEENKLLVKKRDDLYIEYVTLLNMLEKYEEAYEAIMNFQFTPWEGAEGKIAEQYKICLLELAKHQMRETNYINAKELLEEALIYPDNLGEGKLEGTKDNHIYYYLGIVNNELGKHTEARENFLRACEGNLEPAGVMYYNDQPADMLLYQGLSKQNLQDFSGANASYYKLLDFAQKHINDEMKIDYFAVSIPDFLVFDEDLNEKNKAHCYYLMGLAHIGLQNFEKAVYYFNEALRIDSNHQRSMIYIKLAKES